MRTQDLEDHDVSAPRLSLRALSVANASLYTKEVVEKAGTCACCVCVALIGRSTDFVARTVGVRRSELVMQACVRVC
jgi:hypothetical protein